MGKGELMPTESSASAISGRTPRSVKVDRTELDSYGCHEPSVYRLADPARRYASTMSEPTTTEPADAGGAAGSAALQDPTYRHAVVDLLGALAYSELSAFERLAEDSKLAPTLEDKAAVAAMASAEFAHFACLRDRLTELGTDPVNAMEPFQDSVDAFHSHTRPADWLEGLVKAYVGDGLAADFYREIAAFLDADTRATVLETLADTGHSAFAVDRVRKAIENDPRVAGRLALWARRLMGEALSQAQLVAAERDALSALLAGGVDRPGLDLAALGRMFTRLTERHAQRMSDLGLDA
jgi:tRNA-(MS[2]IO[6]A)-hydroxylase (MiaE)-like